MISVLIPERGRPEMLERLLWSLRKQAGGDRDYEILVAIDDDDPAWPVRPCNDHLIHYFVWPRPPTLGVKLNMLAERARGDILWFIGNDMLMETPDWPARMREGVARLPGGIGVPFANSTLSPGEPTYPVITRRMMEAVGHFMEPAFPYWFIDTAWGELGRMIDRLFPIDVTVSAPEGIGRTHALVDLPFWVGYFNATRPERVHTASRLLGGPVPPGRIVECVRRTAHLSTPEFLARWGGTAESPPGPHYAAVKAQATAHMLDRLEAELTGASRNDPPMDPWSDGVYRPDVRAAGRDWPSTALTMIGAQRMRQLRNACEDVLAAGVPGDFIETGVWRGGACIYMAAILEAHGADRTVWAADSFVGLPRPSMAQDEGDRHHTYDQLAVSRIEVEANFARYGLLTRVRVLEGWFRHTLPTAPIERLAILRLDGDMYESTIQALDALYPKLSPGGICIVDDYFMAPCARAVTDYRTAQGVAAPIQFIDGMGVWWRA